jgi:hypothetical protein
MVIGMRTRRVPESNNLIRAMLVLGYVMMAGCSTELSPAEQEFYGRSAEIGAGQKIEDVKRQLGAPTRIVDAAGTCRDRGGNKEWVYESFETPAGRERLQGGSILICVEGQGIVVANFHVYQ